MNIILPSTDEIRHHRKRAEKSTDSTESTNGERDPQIHQTKQRALFDAFQYHCIIFSFNASINILFFVIYS